MRVIAFTQNFIVVFFIIVIVRTRMLWPHLETGRQVIQISQKWSYKMCSHLNKFSPMGSSQNMFTAYTALSQLVAFLLHVPSVSVNSSED